MGKWSHLKRDPRFAAIVDEDAGYLEKVKQRRIALQGEITKEMAGSGLAGREAERLQAVRRYDEAREEKDRIAEEESRVNLEIAALEGMILDHMTDGELDSFKSGGFTYTDYVEPVAKVTDKARLLAWVDRAKMREMLTLPWQTLNAYVKEQIGPGGSGKMPEGVDVGIRRSLRRVKGSR